MRGGSNEKTVYGDLTRRQVLAGVAGAASARLSLSLSSSATVAQNGDRLFNGAWPYEQPPTGHFNAFVSNAILQIPNIYGDLIMLPMGMYYWASDEWLPLLATEWSFVDDENFEVKLREGVVWSDGTDFTARDVLATFWVLRLQSNTLFQYVDEITAPDDYTVNFHMNLPSTVVERYVIRTSPRPASVYGKFADQAQSLFEGGQATNDPEGRQLLDQLNQFRPDNYVGNGPFLVDTNSITSAQFELIKNDAGYLTDQVPFDRLLVLNGRAADVTPLVLADDVDYATHGFAPAEEQQMIAEGVRIVRPPIYSGPGLWINYERHRETLGDVRVRQAIAHAIDRVQNGIVSLAESGVGVEHMTGFSDNQVPDWMAEDAIAGLNTYAFDRELAASLLEEAGWTKDGDVWTMSNGEPARFELTHPAEFQDWSSAASNAAEQLIDFGIDITLLGVAVAQQPEEVNDGAFDIAVRGWGNSSNPHPHFSFVQALFTHNTIPQEQGQPGMAFDLVQQTQVAGKVDLERLTVECAQGLDESLQQEQVTTLAQVFNELLPVIPLWERYGNNPVNEGERVAAWPPDDHPIYQNSLYADGIPTMLMLSGELQPSGG